MTVRDMTMRPLMLLLVILGTLLWGCATAPEKKGEEAQATPVAEKDAEKTASPEAAVPKTEEKGAKNADDATAPEKKPVTADEKQLADEKKKEEEALRNRNYDGLKYVGPAKEEFSKGVESYFSQGCGEAVKRWRNAFEGDSDNGSIAYNIGLCYERQGKPADARQWYEKAVQARNEQIEALYNMALLDMKKGKLQTAEYQKLAEGVSDMVVRNNFLAWLYLKLKNFDECIKYAKAALKEDEMNIEAMITLGTAYFNKDMLELAEMILSTAEQINPNDFKLQRIAGFIQYKQGHKQKATEHFQKAKKINPEIPEVSNMIAILAMEIEDFTTAKNELEFALKIAPDLIEAKLNLAVALKGLKEYKKCREILQGLEKQPGLPKDTLRDVTYNLAILFLDADVEGDGQPQRFDVAVQYLTKYLEMVDKKDKIEQKRIADYIKEAQTEKKKAEAYLKMKAKQEAKRKKEEEEQRLFEQYVKDFEETKAKDTIDAYEAFLARYPELDPEDERGLFAKKRLEELKTGKPSAPPPPSVPAPIPSAPSSTTPEPPKVRENPGQ